MQFAGAPDAVLEGTVATPAGGPGGGGSIAAAPEAKAERIDLTRLPGGCSASGAAVLRRSLACEDRMCQEI